MFAYHSRCTTARRPNRRPGTRINSTLDTQRAKRWLTAEGGRAGGLGDACERDVVDVAQGGGLALSRLQRGDRGRNGSHTPPGEPVGHLSCTLSTRSDEDLHGRPARGRPVARVPLTFVNGWSSISPCPHANGTLRRRLRPRFSGQRLMAAKSKSEITGALGDASSSRAAPLRRPHGGSGARPACPPPPLPSFAAPSIARSDNPRLAGQAESMTTTSQPPHD